MEWVPTEVIFDYMRLGWESIKDAKDGSVIFDIANPDGKLYQLMVLRVK